MTRWRLNTTKRRNGNQSTIFDQTERIRQENMEVAYQFADVDWKNVASNAVRKCALNYPEFTSNEVWVEIGKTGVTTHTDRAIGAIMQAASRAGMIKKVGYAPSARAHNSPVTLWQSLIYRG